MSGVLAFSTPGFWELLTLAVLALLIFGPERLPGMARNAGRMIARFKREAAETLDELKRAAEIDELRGVADELRATGTELHRTAVLAPPAGVTDGDGQWVTSVEAAGPPPFDPDAT
ncbi:MAG TPA: Sec-independent protein translocase protein TatB [Egibacteraceae bacterium]|nr:Sec-independent protein translocase protein TatB [Egibacteraceae bacterium]